MLKAIDRTAILWDVATNQPLRTFRRHTGAVSSVAFSPDGRAALTGERQNGAAVGRGLPRFHDWLIGWKRQEREAKLEESVDNSGE
ncbi:MAG: hypothetical protein ABI947_04445 [Chloroflexota bacterium]